MILEGAAKSSVNISRCSKERFIFHERLVFVFGRLRDEQVWYRLSIHKNPRILVLLFVVVVGCCCLFMFVEPAESSALGSIVLESTKFQCMPLSRIIRYNFVIRVHLYIYIVQR